MLYIDSYRIVHKWALFYEYNGSKILFKFDSISSKHSIIFEVLLLSLYDCSYFFRFIGNSATYSVIAPLQECCR